MQLITSVLPRTACASKLSNNVQEYSALRSTGPLCGKLATHRPMTFALERLDELGDRRDVRSRNDLDCKSLSSNLSRNIDETER